MNSSLYRQFPLDAARMTRVLDIHPDSSPQAALRATLRVISLADCPRFTALSYVWGPQTDSDPTISCSGYDIAVTVNCYQALISLRRLYGHLTIWVDAVSINQSDNAEKAIQIPLMEEIYSWAETVFLWLGQGTAQTDRAMDCIRYTPKFVRCLEDMELKSAPTMSGRMKSACFSIKDLYWTFLAPVGVLQDQIQSRRFDKRFQAEDFQTLLSCDWAERIWTLQEIILARNVVVICGTQMVTWNDFIRGLVLGTWEWYAANSKTIQAIAPTQYDIWMSIIQLWMNFERKSHWNNRQVRRLIPAPRQKLDPESANRRPGISFFHYQALANKMVRALLRIVHTVILLLLMGSLITIMVLYSENKGIFHRFHHTGQVEVLYLNGTFDTSYIVTNSDSHVDKIFWPITSLSLVAMFCIMFFNFMSPLQLVPGSPDKKLPKTIDLSMFLSIQRAIRTRQCKDPRDKSYGLYGVLKDLGVGIALVSYEKPVGLVYQELFLALLHWGGSLNLLLDAGLPGLLNATSWTPDWSLAHTPSRAWLDPACVYSVDGHATTSKSLPVWRLMENSRLVIRGCFRGTVLYCSSPFDAEQDVAQTFFDAFTTIRLRMRLQKESDTIHSAVHEVLYARVMSRVPPEESDVFNYWFQSLVTANSMMVDTHEQLLHWRDLIRLQNTSVTFHRDICDKLFGRVLFVTSDGLLGTAFRSIAVGDHVMLGSGIAMPLILRRMASGAYSHVGPAFIHAMMEGQKWTGEDLEDITLV
ncbi:hypothetical protein BT63DRAFT_472203 [Microthyrium microscopicum]|uniref:Heterokaryon incompatibility domain-containing protein n=1 Tax=Microthyrium microscopicum TaxID=703497 RepID=A0A6A6U5P5_9PEZI|nr:hypothetical protein BT63DRAFT_472203 [Microthyrium microscopicum]